VLDLVCALARIPGRLRCRLDDVSVGLVEIEALVLLEIGFLAVTHDYEAAGHGILPARFELTPKCSVAFLGTANQRFEQASSSGVAAR
jgi:hypothetical protein